MKAAILRCDDCGRGLETKGIWRGPIDVCECTGRWLLFEFVSGKKWAAVNLVQRE